MLKDKNLILESGLSLPEEEEEEKRFEEVVEREKDVVVVEDVAARVEKRSSLRKGSEGDEVRQMQVRFSIFFQ